MSTERTICTCLVYRRPPSVQDTHLYFDISNLNLMQEDYPVPDKLHVQAPSHITNNEAVKGPIVDKIIVLSEVYDMTKPQKQNFETHLRH